jgi:hypothetical protein
MEAEPTGDAAARDTAAAALRAWQVRTALGGALAAWVPHACSGGAVQATPS